MRRGGRACHDLTPGITGAAYRRTDGLTCTSAQQQTAREQVLAVRFV